MASASPEKRLHEVSDRLERLLQVTQDAVVFIDSQARIVCFNPAAERMFGYARDEILGENVRMLMPEPYAAEHDGYIRRYEETRVAKAIGRIRVVRARRKGGEEFPIELSVAELGDDPAIRYCAFIRDTSEKVRLQAENAEKSRLATIGATAAALAHEVGNPLNNMRLSTQMVSRRLATLAVHDEKLGTHLEAVSEEIGRLNQLLEEFRLLSRRQTLHMSDTDMGELVRQICSEHKVEYDEIGIDIAQDVEKVPSVRADAGKLKQALLNLCKNAMEAMPNGGQLTVSLRPSDDAIVLEISDTGAGIPEGLDVFEAFETTKERGTGLGLSIVRQVVASHGGKIDFERRAEGGTTFRLRLPIEGPPPSSSWPPPAPR